MVSGLVGSYQRTATVQSHTASTLQVMVLDTTLVDKLLGSNIASGEEHSRRDTLGEQRAGSQLGIVPDEGELWSSVEQRGKATNQRQKVDISANSRRVKVSELCRSGFLMRCLRKVIYPLEAVDR